MLLMPVLLAFVHLGKKKIKAKLVMPLNKGVFSFVFLSVNSETMRIQKIHVDRRGGVKGWGAEKSVHLQAKKKLW